MKKYIVTVLLFTFCAAWTFAQPSVLVTAFDARDGVSEYDAQTIADVFVKALKATGAVDVSSTTHNERIAFLFNFDWVMNGQVRKLGAAFEVTIRASRGNMSAWRDSRPVYLPAAREGEIYDLMAGLANDVMQYIGAWNAANNAPLLPIIVPPASTAPSYKTGDRGPAGGIVFFDKGDYSNGWRYLEAAPVETEISAVWGTWVDGPATATDIGSGERNTGVTADYSRANGENWGAMQFCDDFIFGGYDDWFLPSKDELNLMYQHLKGNGLGNFRDGYYWSSSMASVAESYCQSFRDGKQHYAGKSAAYSVRAIRSF